MRHGTTSTGSHVPHDVFLEAYHPDETCRPQAGCHRQPSADRLVRHGTGRKTLQASLLLALSKINDQRPKTNFQNEPAVGQWTAAHGSCTKPAAGMPCCHWVHDGLEDTLNLPCIRVGLEHPSLSPRGIILLSALFIST